MIILHGILLSWVSCTSHSDLLGVIRYKLYVTEIKAYKWQWKQTCI